MFRLELWTSAGKQITVFSPKSAPGRFYHVSGTVDPGAGAAVLYVDGVKAGETSWPKTGMKNYGTQAWRIGIAVPKQQKYWGPSKGILDDVRLYARVLTPEEVRLLYDAGSQR